MAKTARCDKCRIRWDITVKDQTPLREMRCPYCCGPVKPVRSIGGPGLEYKLQQGEPEHGLPTWGREQSTDATVMPAREVYAATVRQAREGYTADVKQAWEVCDAAVKQAWEVYAAAKGGGS